MIILRNKNFAYSKGYHGLAKVIGGRNAVRARRGVQGAQVFAQDPVTPVASNIHKQVSAFKDAPLTMTSASVSPIPGTSVAIVEKTVGSTGKTVPQMEGQFWDKTGIGYMTRPIRRGIDKALTKDRFVGAGKGIYNNIRLMAGAPISV